MERAHRAAVTATFFAPGDWAETVQLTEAARHHAAVRRLDVGTVVRMTDGVGASAMGTLQRMDKRIAEVVIEDGTREHVPAPSPLTLLAPSGDRDRMLWLAEKCVELGITRWITAVWDRSNSVANRGTGEPFHQKLRARMIGALEQSGGSWLPVVAPERPAEELLLADWKGSTRLLLDAEGVGPVSIGGRDALVVALGPEGGITPAERELALHEGWTPLALSNSTLRFETAGIAAVAILRSHHMERS